MSLGGLAWLIVAIAILILFGSIALLVYRITKPLKNVLVDADIIAREADELMANANTLLVDVNGKVSTLDPAVKAVADLGVSVSDLNSVTKNLTGKARSSNASKWASAFSTMNNMRKNHKSKAKRSSTVTEAATEVTE